MKRLILCFDGTWQGRPLDTYVSQAGLYPTNVEKTHNAILKLGSRVKDGTVENVHQISKYYAGIGAGESWGLFKGLVGHGISHIICDAYTFVVDNFSTEDLDELYLFGFSRGAFTARSLAGFMEWVGVVRKDRLRQLPLLFDQYKLPDKKRNHEMQGEQLDGFRERDGRIPVRFLGLWDSVGALGVPGVKRINELWFLKGHVGFHMVELPRYVEYAYHALAVHELRREFAPVLWESQGNATSMEQAWFPGTHSDVGGGNTEKGISDIPLLWMIRKAEEECGLTFDRDYLADITSPDVTAPIYNSSSGVEIFGSVRAFGNAARECRHQSVAQRIAASQASGLQASVGGHPQLWDSAEESVMNSVAECIEPIVPQGELTSRPSTPSRRIIMTPVGPLTEAPPQRDGEEGGGS